MEGAEEGGETSASSKAKAVPRKAVAAADGAGSEAVSKTKQRGREPKRSSSRKRDSTPAAIPAVDDDNANRSSDE